MLHPGTSGFGAFKRWPAERFARLARRLAERRARRWPSPSRRRGARGRRRRVAAAAAARRACVETAVAAACSPRSLRARAPLVAARHGAAPPRRRASARRVLGLFGPKDPAVYGPYGVARRRHGGAPPDARARRRRLPPVRAAPLRRPDLHVGHRAGARRVAPPVTRRGRPIHRGGRPGLPCWTSPRGRPAPLFEGRFGVPPTSVGPSRPTARGGAWCACGADAAGTAIGVARPRPRGEPRVPLLLAHVPRHRPARARGLRRRRARTASTSSRTSATRRSSRRSPRGATRGAAAPFPAVDGARLPARARVRCRASRSRAGASIDFAVAHPREAFDRPSMLWDLNYFKYHFLKLADVPFNEDRLEDDFERLDRRSCSTADATHFLYRDFQSRNVMLRGRRSRGSSTTRAAGAARCPTTSPRCSTTRRPRSRRRCATRSSSTTSTRSRAHVPVDRARFREHYRGFVLIRILQAMGAYGYRGFYERKAALPRRACRPPSRNVERTSSRAARCPCDLPELRAVFERIAPTRAARATLGAPAARGPHRARRVASPTAAALPDDPAGNGGGFVFDCRALDEPRPPRAAFAGAHGPRRRGRRASSRRGPRRDAFFEHAPALVEAQVRGLPRARLHLAPACCSAARAGSTAPSTSPSGSRATLVGGAARRARARSTTPSARAGPPRPRAATPVPAARPRARADLTWTR